MNCDGAMNGADVVTVLGVTAGVLMEATEACPELRSFVLVDGAMWRHGDFDCSGVVALLDGMRLLRYESGLGFVAQEEDCPLPGTMY